MQNPRKADFDNAGEFANASKSKCPIGIPEVLDHNSDNFPLLPSNVLLLPWLQKRNISKLASPYIIMYCSSTSGRVVMHCVFTRHIAFQCTL
jgi:hypothetical protein